MTFYIFPRERGSRRYNWNRQAQNDWSEVESDVLIPVNVKAEDDAFVITALMPAVSAEDLSIQVVGDTVTLQGEIKGEVEDEDHLLLREIPTGRFYRVLNLPEPLSASDAQANLDDGVLTLRIAKAEEARPRTIKVKAAKE